MNGNRRELSKTEQFQQVVAERGAEYAEFDVVSAACELYGHHQDNISRLEDTDVKNHENLFLIE